MKPWYAKIGHATRAPSAGARKRDTVKFGLSVIASLTIWRASPSRLSAISAAARYRRERNVWNTSLPRAWSASS
jgi:hypothetical protein